MSEIIVFHHYSGTNLFRSACVCFADDDTITTGCRAH